jgi:hypothetical protein
MRDFVYKLVQRLSEPDSGLSRNRQFELLSSPAGARARRLYNHLRSLAADAEQQGACLAVDRTSDGWLVRLELPARKLKRSAALTDEDVQIISREPARFSPLLHDALRAAGALP